MAACTTLTPTERATRARLAAHARWAREPDREAATAPLRAGLLQRFEREVDPDGTLEPEVRARLAENARKSVLPTAGPQVRSSSSGSQGRSRCTMTGPRSGAPPGHAPAPDPRDRGPRADESRHRQVAGSSGSTVQRQTLRELHQADCLDCGQQWSNRAAFLDATKHVREVGHRVLVSEVRARLYSPGSAS
jgi:hypothetical protein